MKKFLRIKIFTVLLLTASYLTAISDISYAYSPTFVEDMPEVNGVIYASVIDGDNLYIGGNFTTVGGYTRNGLAKISISTGDVDSDFDPSFEYYEEEFYPGSVFSLALSGDYLYVGGDFYYVDGVYFGEFVRLDKISGIADSGCKPNVHDAYDDGTYVNSIYISEDGSFYLGGDFTYVGDDERFGLAKLTSSCTLVDGWSADVFETESNDDGEETLDIIGFGDYIYVGGDFDNIGGVERDSLAKVSVLNGTVDTDFNPSPFRVTDYYTGRGSIYDLVFSGDDLYVGGAFTSIGGEDISEFARINKDSGDADILCNANVVTVESASTVYSIAFDHDDNIYIGGSFTNVGGEVRGSIARLDSSCVVDETFSESNYTGYTNSISLNNTNIFAGGEIGVTGLEDVEYLLHWTMDGPEETENASEKVFRNGNSCEYSKPPSITWIKIEPAVKDGVSGMQLTWVQYGADKVNIKIDDGSGNYPWQISNTLNDGHEFLPNVYSSQKVKLQPVNHCKKGDFGDPISYTLAPRGWYGGQVNSSNGNLVLEKLGCIVFDPRYSVYYIKANALTFSGKASPDSQVDLYINNEKLSQVITDKNGQYLLSYNLPNGIYAISIGQGSSFINFTLNVDTNFNDFNSLAYPCLTCN